ncbi:MAG: type II toxin-antitoxin system PemK/MazF family toxin [Rhodocyclaceae bacterium]|nr:type II toxin-antitoxin system PemK/MazF family toxin [Rhodocyclaceae bacterium]
MPTVASLVLVPFPFSDLSGRKKRPALVLTAPDDQGDFLALAVTSRSHHANAVELDDADLASGRLPLKSWVRTDKVFTLNRSLVLATVGQLRPEKAAVVLSRVCAGIGCNR